MHMLRSGTVTAGAEPALLPAALVGRPCKAQLVRVLSAIRPPGNNIGLAAYASWYKEVSRVLKARVALGPQVQYSLLDRRPDNGMIEFCAKHDIKLVSEWTPSVPMDLVFGKQCMAELCAKQDIKLVGWV